MKLPHDAGLSPITINFKNHLQELGTDYFYCGASSSHVAVKVSNAPSTTEMPISDFFTGGGFYMPRNHCLTLRDGSTDWFWIIAWLVLSAMVVALNLRIFRFWISEYFDEKKRDRNPKLL